MPAQLRRHAIPAALVPLVVMLSLAGAGPTAVGGSRDVALQLACGDTITADTTLDGDLEGCRNNGIVIGADGVTLDLNGHTIAGDGEPVDPCPEDEVCDVGVVVDGHDAVTVRDGSVHGFGAGVLLGGSRGSRVLQVSSSRNEFFGFVVAGSTRTVVRGSSGDENPEPDGDGIGIFGSTRLRILGNSFSRNALGMHVEDSTGLLIQGNRFARNDGPGILVEADRNEVRGNRCVGNGDCVIVAPGDRNVIVGNRIERDEGGIAVENGRGNLVARNVAVRTRFYGIRLGIGKPPIGGARNVVRGNVVRAAARDGFLVAPSDERGVLQANRAIGAGDDGFDVRSRSTRLGRNRALRNGALGIKGAPGVVDRGGNVARGNGDRRQCTHVVCR